MAQPEKKDYTFYPELYGKPQRCHVLEENDSKVLMDLYISRKVVSGPNKHGLVNWRYAVLNEVKRPEVYEGMDKDKPYYYDPATNTLYDNDGDVISFEIITDVPVSPCVGKATTPSSSPSSHTTEKSESEESEQPSQPKLKLLRGLFKPTDDYGAFYSYSGVASIGNGQFICRYRRGGGVHTYRFTEEGFRARFDEESIAKMETEKANPTKLQKPPAPAAKPIASPEPHLRAKVTKIEAQKQDLHKFTVWYEFEDRRNLRMSTVVTSTDGNFHLPLTGGYVWDSNTHDKFRRFWETQNSIDLTLNSPDPENTALPESSTLLRIHHDDKSQQSPSRSPTPSAMAFDGPVNLATDQYWAPGKEFDILSKSTKQPDPHDCTPNVCPGKTPPSSPGQFTMSPGSSPTGERMEFYCLNEEGMDALARFLRRANKYEIETSPKALIIYLQDPRNVLANFRVRLVKTNPHTNNKISCLCFLGMIRKYEDQTVTQFVGDWVYEHAGPKVAEDFWNIPRHFDSDVLNEDSSASSGGTFSAQPGIHKGEDETVRSPHGSPKTPPQSPSNMDPIPHNAVKAADEGNPDMADAIAIGAGIGKIFHLRDFNNAAGMQLELTRMVAQRDGLNDELTRMVAQRDGLNDDIDHLQRKLMAIKEQEICARIAHQRDCNRQKFDAHKKRVEDIHDACDHQTAIKMAQMNKRYKKRQERKKFDAYRKRVEDMHEAFKKRQSNMTAVMKQRYDLKRTIESAKRKLDQLKWF